MAARRTRRTRRTSGRTSRLAACVASAPRCNPRRRFGERRTRHSKRAGRQHGRKVATEGEAVRGGATACCFARLGAPLALTPLAWRCVQQVRVLNGLPSRMFSDEALLAVDYWREGRPPPNRAHISSPETSGNLTGSRCGSRGSPALLDTCSCIISTLSCTCDCDYETGERKAAATGGQFMRRRRGGGERR